MNQMNQTFNMTTFIFGMIFLVLQILLTLILAMGAFYFKQLKLTIDEQRMTTEKRMAEGEARFRKNEECLSNLRAEVYRDYITKPDLIRMMGVFEGKFAEIMDVIEKNHKGNGVNKV